MSIFHRIVLLSRAVEVTKRDFTAEQRKEAAKSGAAMPDGSFPIHNESDLHNAQMLVQDAKDPAAAQKHIESRAKALGVKLKKAEDPVDDKDDKPTAGIQVTNKGDPKYGVFEHELGGEKIGHTVNVLGQGWTAVPAVGEIKGKFKKHVEAQQYLADNHVENTKTRKIEEGAVAASKPKPVKKDGADNEPGDAMGSTSSSQSDDITKAASIVATVTQIRKDWKEFDAERGKHERAALHHDRMASIYSNSEDPTMAKTQAAGFGAHSSAYRAHMDASKLLNEKGETSAAYRSKSLEAQKLSATADKFK